MYLVLTVNCRPPLTISQPPALIASFGKDDAVPIAPFHAPDPTVSIQSVSMTPSPKKKGQAPTPTGATAHLAPSKDDGESGYASKSETEFSLAIFAYSECFDNLDPSPANSSAHPSSLSSPGRFASSFTNTSVVEYFSDMERHIKTKTTPDDQRAYSDTVKARRTHVLDVLRRRKLAFGSEAMRSENKWEFGRRLSVFHSADVIFSFFFPPGVSVPTTREFWGALMALVNEVSSWK